MIEHVLSVAVASVGAEVARVLWHGRLRAHWWPVVAHAAFVAILASWLDPWTALPAVATVGLSWALIDSKRRDEWPGVLASGLSSYPWQIAALLTLGWTELSGIPGTLPSLWLLAAIPIAYADGVPWVLLRPKEWPPSKWDKLYPWRPTLP